MSFRAISEKIYFYEQVLQFLNFWTNKPSSLTNMSTRTQFPTCLPPENLSGDQPLTPTKVFQSLTNMSIRTQFSTSAPQMVIHP